MPDKEAAQILGRDWSSVQHRRYKLGKLWIKPKKRAWTKSELIRLGKDPDDVLANSSASAIFRF